MSLFGIGKTHKVTPESIHQHFACRKKHVLMIANKFLATHPKAGEPTHFYEKILSGEKKHTIRQNYDKWAKKAEQINNATHVLVAKEWTGKPYCSPQKILFYQAKLVVQKLDILPQQNLIYIDDQLFLRPKETIANNDGLSIEDFVNWFSYKKPTDLQNLAILHFSHKFKY